MISAILLKYLTETDITLHEWFHKIIIRLGGLLDVTNNVFGAGSHSTVFLNWVSAVFRSICHQRVPPQHKKGKIRMVSMSNFDRFHYNFG